MRFSELGRWYRSAAPTLGQHSEEILREILGLGDDALEVTEAATAVEWTGYVDSWKPPR